MSKDHVSSKTVCYGCEGNPTRDNSPCTVCGRRCKDSLSAKTLKLSDERILECIAYIDSYHPEPGSAMADAVLAPRELQDRRRADETTACPKGHTEGDCSSACFSREPSPIQLPCTRTRGCWLELGHDGHCD